MSAQRALCAQVPWPAWLAGSGQPRGPMCVAGTVCACSDKRKLAEVPAAAAAMANRRVFDVLCAARRAAVANPSVCVVFRMGDRLRVQPYECETRKKILRRLHCSHGRFCHKVTREVRRTYFSSEARRVYSTRGEGLRHRRRHRDIRDVAQSHATSNPRIRGFRRTYHTETQT